jgi:hypothetical protein
MCSFSTSVWKNIFLVNGTIGNVASTLGRYIKAWWDDMSRGLLKEKRKEARVASFMPCGLERAEHTKGFFAT